MVISTPPSVRFTTVFLTAVVGIVITGVSVIPFQRSETAKGWLIPASGFAQLRATRPGTIIQLNRGEGEQVQAGAVVAVIQTSDQTGLEPGTSVAASISSQALAARQAGAAAIAQLRVEHDQVRKRLTMLRAVRAETSTRIALQEQRLGIAESELRRGEGIAEKGFLPARELEARRANALTAAQDLSSSRQALLGAEIEISDGEARLLTLDERLREIEAEARKAAAGFDQQGLAAQAEGAYRLVSEMSGRIGAMPVRRGQTVQQGDLVAVVMGDDRRLEAEVYVATAAAGFIAVGDPVSMKVDGFSDQGSAGLRGRIVAISEATLRQDDIPISTAAQGERVYRVRIALAEPALAPPGDRGRIRPGMLLTARIITEKTSFWRWAFSRRSEGGRPR